MLWHCHGQVFSKKAFIFERVKQDVLLTLIKFVLTIYDLGETKALFLKEENEDLDSHFGLLSNLEYRDIYYGSD
ncbi:hypothetical protein RHSIM_Rhsim01G0072700 [Rhododendron simsii]|uniref:Uncharacterized protein n=1 Tax=Rhododendron simsii TaxID=118357 RepID=A0A834HQZ1_RHOSS|nr:hypothetical protein RHSIM_Rhsim01G0072700 [Rhododendron simsii]